jgi:hypothetical protein
MKQAFLASFLVLVVAGCFWDRDASHAPGGVKTIVAFPINKWKATVIVANHLFYDRASRTLFDIQIASIDGKAFEDDGRRTKYYYEMNAGPHVIVVTCDYGKVKWTADFDFILDPGETVEITGDVIENAVVLWFADAKTGRPVTAKVTAVDERKKVSGP